MRIGIISDVHGNIDALRRVADDINERSIDGVIVLGDIIFDIFHETDPQGCFDLIESMVPLCWIKGNTDDWLNEIDENFQPKTKVEEAILAEYQSVMQQVSPQLIETVSGLKEQEEIIVFGKRILCVHGSDRKINEPIGVMTDPDELEALFNRLDQDILLCGHTHAPYIACGHGKTVMNVGSVGHPKDSSDYAYGLVDATEETFEFRIIRVKPD